MTLEEINAIVDGVSKPFREQIQAANQRIVQLEERLAAMPAATRGLDGERGEKGEPGRDADPVDVAAITADVLRQIPAPKEPVPVNVEDLASRIVSLIGTPRDGKDVDMSEVRTMVDAAVAIAVAAIPIPQNGPQGERGPEGARGDQGERGIQGEQGQPGQPGPAGPPGERGADGAVGPQGERGLHGEPGPSGPIGERGERGEAGPAGNTGERGERGADGEPGKDAILPDIDAMVDRAMHSEVNRWALDFERRAQELFQRAIDKMPKPKDGRDAFQLEDFSMDHDGDGTVTLKFKAGEFEKAHSLRFPFQRYRSVWREDENYREGHSVTFGGSTFTAMVDNPTEKPGTGSQWQLSVKRGKDGRDGIMKEPPVNGPVSLK